MTDQLSILYSFRRCPYAMRARLAILSSGVRCELREVVLREKPKPMLDISPKGTVPVLQLSSGQVIEESLDIMIWALRQKDPENWLKPSLEDMLSLIKLNDTEFKRHLDRYKYATRYDNADPLLERQRAETFLIHLEERLQQSTYLCSEEPCLADYAIFPFIRQFAFTDKDWFDASSYDGLKSWLEFFLGTNCFKTVMSKYPQWQEGDAPVLFNT